jgi:hypothetical protein
MNPDTEPENRAVMSLQAAHSIVEAAKSNPAAIDNCKRDHVLLAVFWLTLKTYLKGARFYNALSRGGRIELPNMIPLSSSVRSSASSQTGFAARRL